MDTYTFKRNNEFLELRLDRGTTNVSGSWSTILTIDDPQYRPATAIRQICENQCLIKINTSGDVQIARYNGSATSTEVHTTFLWKIK